MKESGWKVKFEKRHNWFLCFDPLNGQFELEYIRFDYEMENPVLSIGFAE